MFESPSRIDYLKKFRNTQIYIKRDDLIPFSYGGNKVRMAREVFMEMKDGGFNAVISYGSDSSNMNRAIAQMAVSYHIPCVAIIKKENIPEGVRKETGNQRIHGGSYDDGFLMPMNERLVRESGAKVILCSGQNVRNAVEEAIKDLRLSGKNPYYVYGDSTGHGSERTLMRAFLDEMDEIRAWENKTKVYFDHIFLPVGTALTISGFVAGEKTGGGILHGISVARDADTLKRIIKENLRAFYKNDGHAVRASESLCLCDISDEYLCGGYGCFNKDELDMIQKMYAGFGIALDPVYTGKAFYGMLSEIKNKRLCGNCLFVHTGGYPLFLDAQEKIGKVADL